MIGLGSTANIFAEFNFYEAFFWIGLSIILSVLTLTIERPYRNWMMFNTVNIFLFGVTDIVELYTGGFLHTAGWLLVWKAIHVAGLVVGVGWYLQLRLKTRK